MKSNGIFNLYKTLHRKYGKPEGQWKLWCKRPKTLRNKEEVVIGAFLTQRTNWRNVELAVANLRNEKSLSLKAISILGKKKLKKMEQLIRPSGFYQSKAKYLASAASFILKSGGLEKISRLGLEKLRPMILDLPGVGQETADSILLYAMEKPVFVIDAYTRRLLIKTGDKSGNLPYEALREKFEACLTAKFKQCSAISGAKSIIELYQDFHALIVIEGKNNK